MDVQILIDGEPYVPFPTISRFHASPAQRKALLGGWGCGKTAAASIEGIVQSLEVKRGDPRNAWGMITRYNWNELLATSWPQFLSLVPEEILRRSQVKEGGGSRTPEIIFPNGFKVVGFNLKNHKQLGSFNLCWAWIDEVNEDGIEEDSFLQLSGRLRNTSGRGSLWITGNPEGRNWVWKRFYAWEEDPNARRYKNHEGWIVKTTENTRLRPDYYDNMRETLPEEWLERYFEGSFDIFEGQIITEWDTRIHWVHPFDLDIAWPRYRGMDHGINHPTVCLWAAQDFDDNTIIYREHVKRNISPVEHTQIIEALTGRENIQWTVGDPAMRERQTAAGVVQSILQQYREAGLDIIEGDNDVRASIALMKRLLQPDPEHRFPYWHPLAGQPGSPRLFVTRDCSHLKWELENWKWRHVRPGQPDREKPLAVNDDAIACFVAGTMVETTEGSVPIEDVKVGMEVYTRFGPRKVIASDMSSPDAECITLTCSDGRELTGTPTHRIWKSHWQAWVPMAALRYGDILTVWNPNSSSTEGSSSGATPAAATSRPTSRIVSWVSRIFTGKSGRTTSGLSLPAVRSIIGTTTRRTMNPPTSNVSLSRSTVLGIWKLSVLEAQVRLSWLIWNVSARLPGRLGERGRRRKRDAIAYLLGQKSSGPVKVRFLGYASDAETAFQASQDAIPTASVLRSAALTPAASPAPTTRTAPAPPAERSSDAIATPGSGTAPVSVHGFRDAGTQPVYNLTVEGQHEYYANGILVHNSLRYLLMRRPRAAEAQPLPSMNNRILDIIREMAKDDHSSRRIGADRIAR